MISAAVFAGSLISALFMCSSLSFSPVITNVFYHRQTSRQQVVIESSVYGKPQLLYPSPHCHREEARKNGEPPYDDIRSGGQGSSQSEPRCGNLAMASGLHMPS